MKLRWFALALLGVFSAAPALSQSATAQAQQSIRARRESSNQAIAKHDTAGIGAILAPDVVVVSSRSDKTSGRDANVTAFVGQFRTRPGVVYRRTPEVVTVFAPWAMASERGHWDGSWTDTDGNISIGGSYFAKWRLLKGTWYVESETYVPERCAGGKVCTIAP